MPDKDQNKDSSMEYEQYSQASSGRLFSSAMFGFNKEEVLEYLDEIADDNFQRQEAAEMQLQELKRSLAALEEELQSKSRDEQVPSSLLQEKEELIEQVRRDLDISRAAVQQAEGELLGVKQSLQALKQENAWLRQEASKRDNEIASLHKQLEEITEGQWDSAQEEITQLRQRLEELDGKNEDNVDLETENEDLRTQLEDALERIEWFESQPESEIYAADSEDDPASQNSSVRRTASEIINEAYLEADRIRKEAVYERDRIQRQMQNSTGDISESINNLRTEISGMEGDVGDILELVQAVLADVLNSLSRTEQNLNTFDTQVKRFPAASPPVPKPQVLYFQPQHTTRLSSRAKQTADVDVQDNSERSSFRRILPSGSTSNSAAAIKTSFVPSFTAQAVARPSAELAEHDERREQMRELADNLAETLLQMIDTEK